MSYWIIFFCLLMLKIQSESQIWTYQSSDFSNFTQKIVINMINRILFLCWLQSFFESEIKNVCCIWRSMILNQHLDQVIRNKFECHIWKKWSWNHSMRSWKSIIMLWLTSYYCTHNQQFLWCIYYKSCSMWDWISHNQSSRESH